MSMMPGFRRLLVAAVLVLTGTAVAAAWQQARPDDSLAGVSAELRLLRLSVEGSLRSQTEMNAMGVLLTTVQSRITQLTARLDGLRDEISEASAKAQEAANIVLSDQNAIARETDQARRNDLIRFAPHNKAEADKLAAREQDLRTRESQLTNDLRLEEARWAEFVSRLELLTKR